MSVLLTVLEIPWVVGMVVASFVLPRRVGIRVWLPTVLIGVWAHEPSRRHGIPWAIISLAKVIAWPIFLVLWYRKGQPESRVLFGSAAAERLGIFYDDSYGQRGFATMWKQPAH